MHTRLCTAPANRPSIAFQRCARTTRPLQTPKIVCAASSASSGASPDATVKQILALTRGTNITTAPDEVDALCGTLRATAQPARTAMKVGQGTWRVVCAPHIKTLAGVLGATIDPVQYTMKGDVVAINVKLTSGLFGTVWLNAAANCTVADDNNLALKFTRYWFDSGEDALRAQPPTESNAKPYDGLVNTIGLLAFVVDSTKYPVLFVNERMAVFKFTMLDTRIAIAKQ